MNEKHNCLWEILVPTARDNGNPIRTKFHKAWDDQVRKISGGMTILRPAKGQWIAPNGQLFKERMIPVRISCTKDEIEQIADITANYYEQKSIFYYKISDYVVIKYYNE